MAHAEVQELRSTGRPDPFVAARSRPDSGPKSPPSTVAYLVNRYPAISHTFIRREIEALERNGVAVARFSVRRCEERLLTAADRDEAARTTVLLERAGIALAWAGLRAALTKPWRFFRALALAVQSGRRSARGLLVNLAYLAEASILVDLLRRRGVRHVHAHFGTNPATVAMLCGALDDVTYSFTAHGPEEFDNADLWHLADKIRRAAFVVAVSSYGRSQLYRHCSASDWPKIEVVRCGVDGGFLQARSEPIPAARRLVSVARLAEQKGLPLLLDALGELHRLGRPFEMVLVGDGELRGEIERTIVRLGLEGKVRLVGWADEVTVRSLIQQARALVLPSFAEGLPVVLMEALALGRPVVATYVAGIPELVTQGGCGWLVPAGSHEDLVSVLEEVLSCPVETLERLGASGRARVGERHDIDRIGKQIAALMKRWA